MKTQIIKIIPCLVAGFILSACVGAVNLAEGALDSPETALINRCIMDDNANASSCASIVEDNPCITDPFDVACDITFTNFYKTAQANRISFCRDNYDSDFCQSAGDAIKNICLADPFDSLCFIVSASSYNNARETTCADEPTSSRCEATVYRVCFSDSFNTLCLGNERYYHAQQRACTNNNTDPRCESTIARVCSVDSLDAVCNGLTAYFPMQKTACADEPNSSRCHPTIVRVCGLNAFDALCQLSNLTLRDIPTRPNGFFSQNTVNMRDNTPSASCSRSYSSSTGARSSCYVHIPNIISIKPLNDANTGTATYAGSVVLQHLDNHFSPNCNRDRCRYNYKRSLTKNIDIIADFGNNTLSYSGDWGSSDTAFNINGNFTDRGILTGTVNFNTTEAPLIGLIGQDEAIGVFSTGNSNKKFAGGFTATRE